MKNNYLLDTNICIALLRGNRDVAQKLIDLGEGRCCLSVITLYELMFGAYYSRHNMIFCRSCLKRLIVPCPTFLLKLLSIIKNYIIR